MRDSVKNVRIFLRSTDCQLMYSGGDGRGVRSPLRQCGIPSSRGRGNPSHLGVNHDQNTKLLPKGEETGPVFPFGKTVRIMTLEF